jgi:thioredoxin-related protein
MKKFLFVALLAVVIFAAFSFVMKPQPQPEASGIKWMTWKEMQEAEKHEHRKVFVDVYTGWCGWCKRMDASTFTDPNVVRYVNANFYAVKFDAETRSDINFRGKDYKYVSQGMQGYNELAAEILNNQMSYPTSVYFDEKLDEIFPVPGYQEVDKFEQVLDYVATDSYKTTKFDDFQKDYKGLNSPKGH